MSTNRADFSEAMKDPVCGMSVDPATAKHVHTPPGRPITSAVGIARRSSKPVLTNISTPA